MKFGDVVMFRPEDRALRITGPQFMVIGVEDGNLHNTNEPVAIIACINAKDEWPLSHVTWRHTSALVVLEEPL